MSLDLATLRAEVREHLGYGDEIATADGSRTEGWRDANIDLLINLSFWEISDKYPFRLKDASVLLTTTIGERSYDMPIPYEALKLISIEGIDGQEHKPLDRMSLVKYESVYVDNDDNYGKPTNYVREADHYLLWPTPNDEYEITIKFLTVFDDIADANDELEDAVPRIWHEIILNGAISRGFYRQRNVIMGREFRALMASLIQTTSPVEAKEEEDSRHAGLSIPEEWNDRRNI